MKQEQITDFATRATTMTKSYGYNVPNFKLLQINVLANFPVRQEEWGLIGLRDYGIGYNFHTGIGIRESFVRNIGI